MGRADILVAGSLMGACYIGILALGDAGQRMPVFFALFGAAYALYLWAVCRCDRVCLLPVVVLGVVFRATLLLAEPTLSDDIYRYVWDGRVQALGINPYVHAPNSEALAPLRDETIYPKVNHPHIPTVYPPLAQAVFLVIGAVWPGVLGMKFALVGFDMLTAWLLLGLMRRRGVPEGRLLVYFWNPLLVVEVAGQGHVDILGVAFLVMSLLYLEVERHGRALVALGLSFLGKFFPICMLPVAWQWTGSGGDDGGRARWLGGSVRGQNAWPILVFLGVVLLGYLPYIGAGPRLFAAFWNYARHWEFNSLVFWLLRMLLRDGDAARVVIGALFGGAVLAMTVRRTHPLRAGYVLTGVFIWLTPTLHHWYVVWMIPFLVFYRSPAWLVFAGLVALSYHVLIRYSAEGIWEEALWVRGMEYGGFALAWVGDRVWSRFSEAG